MACSQPDHGPTQPPDPSDWPPQEVVGEWHAGTSAFLKALWELNALHERELQAVRETVEEERRRASDPGPTTPQPRPSVAETNETAPVSRPRPSRESSGFVHSVDNDEARVAALWSKRQSQSTSRINAQLLSEDLALIKGWSDKKHDHSRSFSASVRAANYKVQWLNRLLKNQVFDAVCSAMIILNAVLMGFSVNWDAEHCCEDDLPKFYVVTDRIFTVWFVFELVLRLLGNGVGFFYRKDFRWNIFDFVVVAADITIVLVQLQASDVRGSSGNGNISVVRLLRVLRVTRALRIVRLFRFFRELRMMVFSVLQSGTSLIWSVVLLFMDVYLFSVYLVQNVATYFDENGEDAPHKDDLQFLFGNMIRAFYTLFMAVSGGISWVEISEPLLKVHWTNALIFAFFIFFTVYALTNIITGIFVDTAIQSAQSDRDEVIQSQLSSRDSTLQQMKELFTAADEDSSGTITITELESHLSDERVRAHLMSLGLQLDEARGLFRLLDMDKSGALTIDEFIFGCMRLKGHARSIDLATLMYEQKKMFMMMRSCFAFVEEELGKIEFTVHGLAMQPGAKPVLGGGDWQADVLPQGSPAAGAHKDCPAAGAGGGPERPEHDGNALTL